MTLLQSINLDLANKLREKTYRDIFFEDWANDEVASQLRRLRKFRNLRQVDVAEVTGMKQSAVSRIEQAAYSRWNFATLTRIAQALDVRIRVTFEPAEDVIREYEQSEVKPTIKASALAARKAEVEARESQEHMRQGLLKNTSGELAKQGGNPPETPKFQPLARHGSLTSRSAR